MNQDNPFAKGASINQDMLTDEFSSVELKGGEDMTPNKWERIGCVDYDPANPDRYNADLYANHPTLNRELLALGREEE